MTKRWYKGKESTYCSLSLSFSSLLSRVIIVHILLIRRTLSTNVSLCDRVPFHVVPLYSRYYILNCI